MLPGTPPIYIFMSYTVKNVLRKKPMSSVALQQLPSFNTRISHSGYKTLLPADSAQFPLSKALKAT